MNPFIYIIISPVVIRGKQIYVFAYNEFLQKNPLPNGKGLRHLSMRTAGSHNCSRSAPALQLNVDLLSAKGS